MTQPGKHENGWNEWSRHVLAELERLNSWSAEIANRQTTILVQISALKVKSGIWGLIGGAIPVIIGLAIWAIKSHT